MGVKDFSDTFGLGNSGRSTFATIRGMRVAIDAYREIIAAVSVQHHARLTTRSGEATTYIQATLARVVGMIENGIEAVWCFDSPERVSDKKATLESRQKRRDEESETLTGLRTDIESLEKMRTTLTREQLGVIDPDFDQSLETKRQQADVLSSRVSEPGQFGRRINDILRILRTLGVAYCVAPPEVEAEQLCAYLCRIGRVDGVVTTDSDALVYGAPWVMRKIPGQSGRYNLWRHDWILEKYELTHVQFVRACVTLGTDYNAKTAGVGPATVLQRIRAGTLTFTPEQERAVARFTTVLSFTPAIVRSERTPETVEELGKWLVSEKDFSATNVAKLFQKLNPPAKK